MLFKISICGLAALPSVLSFAWVAQMPGVNKEFRNPHADMSKRQTAPGCYSASCCPFNKNHPGAAPFNPKFPYLGAQNGLPATRTGNVEVPADGDTAHAFEAPGPNDIRGPCPGLNTMANHHVSSHLIRLQN